MKFFHVYNETCFEGLVKNGMINRDTGFKIQHCFAVPEAYQFNKLAAVGGRLYNLLRDTGAPFYVDRIAGGITYYPYRFDRSLIAAYRELLGDWFLGFQLHESASNRRVEWKRMMDAMGTKGHFDARLLRQRLMSASAVTPDGEHLVSLSHDTPEYYATRTYAETVEAFEAEIRDLFARRLADTDNNILPCDSYYLFSRLQREMGMRTFMPEVGCQIPMTRVAAALARGTAKAAGRTWGEYYECWRAMPDGSYCMPCFNSEPVNEWYLTQQTHTDDFTSFGKNGGSSRLLQNRLYFHALMSGADYFSEEWGLNCSYTDMREFTLSEYGIVKKNFLRTAQTLRGIRATIPFAVILPRDYPCVELPDIWELDGYRYGVHRDEYMKCRLTPAQKSYYGHIEDVIKLIFGRVSEKPDSEAHVLTNSRFGDLFDILYADEKEEILAQYDCLIDATAEDSFRSGPIGSKLKTLSSRDLGLLEQELRARVRAVMPCVCDGLDWLVSTDEAGTRYLSIFNNEGNNRFLDRSDVLDHEADTCVTVRFHVPARPEISVRSCGAVSIQADAEGGWRVFVPAAGFAILTF